MTTALYQKTKKSLDQLVSPINSANGQNSVSNIKKIIVITTNKKSAKTSEKILKEIFEIQESMLKSKGKNKPTAKELTVMLKRNNKVLGTLNEFFATIKNIFDSNNDESTLIKVDEPNMLNMLANLQKVKSIMEYISEYIQFVVLIKKAESEPKKKYSVEDLLQHIKAA
jgi:hypothetical protein